MNTGNIGQDARSVKRLDGVDSDLVRVIEIAAQLTPEYERPFHFIVTEGLRTKERQAQLVKAGASRTMNSKHLTGRAVDLAVVVDGEVRWDWPLYETLGELVQEAARVAGVAIVWGGDWPRFRDGPHFELA